VGAGAEQPAAGSHGSATLEAPSGKDAAYENFPVGSWLLPAALRPHVATFYAFARAIDDIADSSTLTPADKVARLEAFERALLGRPDAPPVGKALAMRASLAATGVPARHCTDLIAAFKQDAVKSRYADWDDLMGYCIKSAAPVGRYLLDLHGGSRHGYGPSDALCNALQVINHLQDCADDYRTLDRVYLPEDWLRGEGAQVEDLARTSLAPGLRRVLDRCLDGIDALLLEARPLPPGLASRRLAMESAVILDIAAALSTKLRREDPLACRVALGKPAFAWCGVRGVARALSPRRRRDPAGTAR
jgi:squalene synthase HpnC